MPNSVPNYLTSSANGNIGAQFPGGVKIISGSAPPATPPDEGKVMWVAQTDGSLVAQVYGYRQPGQNFAVVEADYGNAVGRMTVQANNPGDASIGIFANGGTGNADAINLLTSTGYSQMVRWLNSTNLKIQLFDALWTAAPVGVSGLNVTLPFAWTSIHSFVMVSLKAASGGNWGAPAGSPSTLTQATIYANNPVVQDLTYTVLSFGR